MASTAAKTSKSAKAAKPAAAARRFPKLPFKPTGGLTRAQIRKAVRDVIAQRQAQPQG